MDCSRYILVNLQYMSSPKVVITFACLYSHTIHIWINSLVLEWPTFIDVYSFIYSYSIIQFKRIVSMATNIYIMATYLTKLIADTKQFHFESKAPTWNIATWLGPLNAGTPAVFGFLLPRLVNQSWLKHRENTGRVYAVACSYHADSRTFQQCLLCYFGNDLFYPYHRSIRMLLKISTM